MRTRAGVVFRFAACVESVINVPDGHGRKRWLKKTPSTKCWELRRTSSTIKRIKNVKSCEIKFERSTIWMGTIPILQQRFHSHFPFSLILIDLRSDGDARLSIVWLVNWILFSKITFSRIGYYFRKDTCRSSFTSADYDNLHSRRGDSFDPAFDPSIWIEIVYEINLEHPSTIVREKTAYLVRCRILHLGTGRQWSSLWEDDDHSWPLRGATLGFGRGGCSCEYCIACLEVFWEDCEE